MNITSFLQFFLLLFLFHLTACDTTKTVIDNNTSSTEQGIAMTNGQYSVNNSLKINDGSALVQPTKSGQYPSSYFSQVTYKKLTADEQKIFARQMAEHYMIVDGHVDLPYRLVTKNFRLTKEFLSIPVESAEGDFDFVRSKKGGLDAPIMSIYIPSSHQETGTAKVFADSLIDMVQAIIKANPDRFGAVDQPADLIKNFKLGKVSLPMGMENGAPVMDDVKNVKYFYDRGIRYITLTHSKDNQICDSSYDTTGTWNGLSPFGEQVVREMNKVGMLVDISHVSDNAYYDVLKIVNAPVIASHSSLRHFTPDFERNMADNMLPALAKNGGVVMINFGSTFIDGNLRKLQEENRVKLTKMLADQGVSSRDEAGKTIIDQFQKDNPTLYADVELVADHIERVINLIGIDYVGLGSDFDGVGDSLPTGLKDVEAYPNLVRVLLNRGYEGADIEKICSGNFMRVWNKANEVAGR